MKVATRGVAEDAAMTPRDDPVRLGAGGEAALAPAQGLARFVAGLRLSDVPEHARAP
jgi:hypothetical protein